MAQKKQKFIDCDHFIKANQILKSLNLSINWNLINGKDIVEDIKEKIESVESQYKNWDIIIFTDGSCFPNNSSPASRAGYSSIITGKYNIILYGNIEIDVSPTNQRAEGIAIYKSMKYLRNKEWETLKIVTDSEFWINMFSNYMPKWYKMGGYEYFEDKKNSDITCKMYEIYMQLSKTKKIEFMHIKSHNKSGWKDFDKNSFEYLCYTNNEKADEYANKARTELKEGEHKKV